MVNWRHGGQSTYGQAQAQYDLIGWCAPPCRQQIVAATPTGRCCNRWRRYAIRGSPWRLIDATPGYRPRWSVRDHPWDGHRRCGGGGQRRYSSNRRSRRSFAQVFAPSFGAALRATSSPAQMRMRRGRGCRRSEQAHHPLGPGPARRAPHGVDWRLLAVMMVESAQDRSYQRGRSRAVPILARTARAIGWTTRAIRKPQATPPRAISGGS